MRSTHLALGFPLVAGALLASCSSSDASIRVAFSSDSLQADEDGGAIAVSIELRLPSSKDPLEEAVTVEVVDAGSGTADGGSDYQAFAPTTVTFPAGSQDGDVEEVTLNVSDDQVFEGDETVVLRLQDASGAKIGSGDSVTVTLVDDEGPAALETMVDVGNGDEPISSGAAISFGMQQAGAEPGDPVLLTLRNAGDAALPLLAPVFGSGDVIDFSAVADPDEQTTAKSLPGSTLRPGIAVLAADPVLGWELALDPALPGELEDVSRARLEGVPLPDLGAVTLELERVPSPWAPDAELRIDGVPLEGGPGALLEGLSLWKGTVAGWPRSSLFLSFSPHGTRGWLRLDPEDGRSLHVLAGEAPGTVRCAWGEQLPAHGFTGLTPGCGGVRFAPGGSSAPPAEAPAPDADAPPTLKKVTPAVCRVAFETDHQFFELFGDEAEATTYVTQLVGAVSDLYAEHVQTSILIDSLAIYPSEDDPWTAPDGGASMDALLDEFSDERSPLPADVAVSHFISGATYPDAAGLAFFDTLCDSGFGFSITGFADGQFDAGAFDGMPAVVNFDFNTVAHELGHNFGALHTDQYCPPPDSCQASCASNATCSSGTIMSNCNVCVGGELNILPEFHAFVANEMRTAVNASCLGTSSLAPGETLVLSLNFAPHEESGTGPKSASLEIQHGATNAPSPFRVTLQGTATN